MRFVTCSHRYQSHGHKCLKMALYYGKISTSKNLLLCNIILEVEFINLLLMVKYLYRDMLESINSNITGLLRPLLQNLFVNVYWDAAMTTSTWGQYLIFSIFLGRTNVLKHILKVHFLSTNHFKVYQ